MKYALPLILLLTLNFNGSAEASESRRAAVYHCGKDGRELRDSPCPDAPAKAATNVNYDKPGTAEEREARERAKADAHRANAAEKQRLAAEAKARRETARAGSLGAAAAPAASSKPQTERTVKSPKPRKASKPHKPAKAASA